jgi:hypothetical protein
MTSKEPYPGKEYSADLFGYVNVYSIREGKNNKELNTPKNNFWNKDIPLAGHGLPETIY